MKNCDTLINGMDTGHLESISHKVVNWLTRLPLMFKINLHVIVHIQMALSPELRCHMIVVRTTLLEDYFFSLSFKSLCIYILSALLSV